MTRSKPKRRLLRFSLSTLLIALTIGCVWLGGKVEKARKQREAVAWVRGMRGTVAYDYEFAHGDFIEDADPPGPDWLINLVGVDFVSEVVYALLYSEQECNLMPLTRLRSLKILTLSGPGVGDISAVAQLTDLEELDLGHTFVADVTPLAGLTSLVALDLDDTDVVDITPLSNLVNLRSLSIQGTKIVNVSPLSGLTKLWFLDLDNIHAVDLSPLAGLTNLEWLSVYETDVSDIAPLAHLTSLKQLHLNQTTSGAIPFNRQSATPLDRRSHLRRILGDHDAAVESGIDPTSQGLVAPRACGHAPCHLARLVWHVE